MKVVLFCGGLGTRIREYSEAIPKPMVPIGSQPILWHIMQYYSDYGHHDFILCLGYKAGVIKDYFLNYNQTVAADCVTISKFGSKVEILGARPPDWRVTLIDTGIWRNTGARLMAVKHLVEGEEIFLANYADGLSDAPLPDMIDRFRKSKLMGCFIAVHPPFSFHLAEIDGNEVRRFRSSQEANIWINGGFFIFRSEIFEFLREGEDLVPELSRLAEKGMLMAYNYEGFWRAMDTLRDRQVLDEMVERGEMPWRPSLDSPTSVAM